MTEPGRPGNGGWKPVQLLLLGGIGLGGAGTIGVGFEVNSARITANENWLTRLQAHTLAQDQELTARRLEISAQIGMLRDEITALRRELSAQIEMIRDEMIPRDFRMETVQQFQMRLDRIQQELNAVRDRVGSGRSRPDEP